IELTDDQLALLSVIENLQREALNDADRGDGIAQYIKLRVESQNVSAGMLKHELSTLLGLGVHRIEELLRVAGLDEELKRVPDRRQNRPGGAPSRRRQGREGSGREGAWLPSDGMNSDTVRRPASRHGRRESGET